MLGVSTVSEHTLDRLPHVTVYNTSPPWADFSMVDISTVGVVSVPQKSALETSRRGLCEDVSFGMDILSVVEQSILENHPRAA